MIIEYIRYEVEDAAGLIQAYEAARQALDSSPHCLAYELSRCSEAPASLILRIEWASLDAHVEGFRKSPAFGAFLAAVRPFVGQIREMRHYEVTSVVSRKPAAAR